MQANSFKSAHRLASTTVFTLSVVVVCYFLEIIYSVLYLTVFPTLGESDNPTTPEIFLGLAAFGLIIVKILFFIATVVFFLMWMYRAYKNLAVFNVQNLETTGGWAVGYWFIPILNLFKPLKAVNEIYHGSNPENVEKGYAFSDTSTPAVHGLWWAGWLLSNFANRIANMIERSARDVTNTSIMFDTISLSLGILAGILLILIIRDIDARQTEIERKLSVYSPPMPPAFNQQPTPPSQEAL